MRLKNHKILIFIISAFLIYSSFFIYNSRIEVGGKTYFTLLDDAMISMRYASHLASGNGPYWNITGDRVCGYTNPLWMGIMSLVHLFCQDKAYTSLFIQILSSIILALNIYLIYSLTFYLSGRSKLLASLSTGLIAFYLPIITWSLLGMEVGLLTLLISLTCLLLIKSKYLNVIPIIIFFGILVRMDFAIIILPVSFYIYYKLKNKILLFQLFIYSLISVATLLLFNLIFYGELLPNTYYLKMEGVPIFTRLLRGFYYILVNHAILLPFILLTTIHIWKIKYSKCIFLASIVGLVFLYSIYTGGDSWEWWHGTNRFITPVIPILFVGIVLSINYFIQKLRLRANIFNRKFILIFFVFLFWLATNSFNGIESIRELLLIQKPALMKDNKFNLELALNLKTLLSSDAKAAVVLAGVLPYFNDREYIDILGKNDRTISHLKSQIVRFRDFVPGHNKWDYSYSIGYLKPDAVLQLWTNHQDALPYLSPSYKLINVGPGYIFIRK